MMKRFLLVLFNKTSRSINPTQATIIKQAMIAGKKYIEIGEDLYSVASIAYIKKQTQYEDDLEKEKKELLSLKRAVRQETIIAVTKAIKQLPCNTSAK